MPGDQSAFASGSVVITLDSDDEGQGVAPAAVPGAADGACPVITLESDDEGQGAGAAPGAVAADNACPVITLESDDEGQGAVPGADAVITLSSDDEGQAAVPVVAEGQGAGAALDTESDDDGQGAGAALDTESDDDGQGAGAAPSVVTISLQIFKEGTIQSKCDPVRSGLLASTVAVTIISVVAGQKDEILGTILCDQQSFDIVDVFVDNQIRRTPTRRSIAYPFFVLRDMVERLEKYENDYFIRDFYARIQTSEEQELALYLTSGTPDTLRLQWRGTDSDGCPLSLELKGRRQVVV